MARRPLPRGGRRPPPGRRPPRDEPVEEELSPQPPIWERIILAKTFRLVVGTTLVAAAIAVLIFLIGPSNISRKVGAAAQWTARSSLRVDGLASFAIAGAIQDEGRRLWKGDCHPTPNPDGNLDAVADGHALLDRPSTQACHRAPTHTPPKPLKPGEPQTKPLPGPQLPIDDADNSIKEDLKIVGDGDTRRALQYWGADQIPEARSARDATIARGEKYDINTITPRPLPQISGVEIQVDMQCHG